MSSDDCEDTCPSFMSSNETRPEYRSGQVDIMVQSLERVTPGQRSQSLWLVTSRLTATFNFLRVQMRD